MRTTSHIVLFRKVRSEEISLGDGDSFIDADAYEFLECRGCGHLSLRHAFGSTTFDDDIRYYPTAISRRQPKWIFDLVIPVELRQVLREVYVALHNNLPRLAAAGIRAVVDIVVTKQVGDIGPFSMKLDQFEGEGFISRRQKEVLLSVFDIGSASAHRGHKLSSEEISSLMDIVEGVLASVYVHPHQSAELVKRTPPRVKGKKGDGGKT